MNFYITTSIPYVNGEPHLGHAMEFTLADVLARHARLQGKPTIFSIGTDEHGGKVANKATEKGLSPKQFADQVSEQFRNLAKELNISNDRFIRTTDEQHEKGAQAIWQKLADDIYKASYEGWYCTGCEAFVTETVVKANNGVCPDHNTPYEKIKEVNYFFKLSKYTSQIKEAIENGTIKIIPETRKNEILSLINEGLEDLSISRPKEHLSWGIEVPGDSAQVMYVWFEALLNYITVLNYPDGADFKDYWPANYQVIGKDILRFHAAIWPGILFALGLELPKVLYVHGHINVDSQKMSKSLGNSITPAEIVDKYGIDTFRYFFLRHIPSYEDGDFTWERLDSAYQNELGNELGNAVNRTVAMVSNYLNGELTSSETSKNEQVDDAIVSCRFDRALDLIWADIKNLNRFIDDKKPWELHKNGSSELAEVLNSQVSQLRNIAESLRPFLPGTAEKMTSIFKGDKVSPIEGTLFPRLDVKSNA